MKSIIFICYKLKIRKSFGRKEFVFSTAWSKYLFVDIRADDTLNHIW